MRDYKVDAASVKNFIQKCRTITQDTLNDGTVLGINLYNEYHEMLKERNVVLFSFPARILDKIEKHLVFLRCFEGPLDTYRKYRTYNRHLLKVQRITEKSFYRYY